MKLTRRTRITRGIRSGEIQHFTTVGNLLNDCGALLDRSESHEILGAPVFEVHGKFYVVHVEAVIVPISKARAKEIQAKEG